MPVGGVVVQFRADVDKAIKTIDKVTRSLGRVEDGSVKANAKFSKMAKVGLGAVAAGAGIAAVSMFKFAEAAIADEKSASKMAQAVKRVTKATDDQIDSLESWITQQGIAFGIADDDLRPALTRLVRSTKDVAKAQKMAKLAMDISAGTGKDYEVVVTALAKANDGNVNALKRLGITLGDNAENAVEYTKAQDALAKAQISAQAAMEQFGPKSTQYKSAMERVAGAQEKVNALAAAGIDWQKELGREFAGAAATAAGTVSGTWERLKLIFGEIGESIGQFALPPLQALADWFADENNIGKVQAWIDKIGEFSKEIGEKLVTYIKTTFIPFVEDELIPTVQGVYDYFGSEQGQADIQSFGDSLMTVADAFKAIAKAIETVVGWWSKLPKIFKADLISLLKPPNMEGSFWTKENVWGTKPTRSGGGSFGRDEGPVARGGGGNVTVVVNNGRQEPTLDSAALALRLGRRAVA